MIMDNAPKYIEGKGWRSETKHSMKRRKPWHDYYRIDTCAEGSLLQISPWEYHMEQRTITRAQCLELNTLAESISKVWLEKMVKLFE